MCELFAARSATPFRLDDIWPFAERLERFGIAGFGWGVAWRDAGGRLERHRAQTAFRDDPERERLGGLETSSALVHLRRPSRLSTLTLPDTQPFLDPAGRFAFAHNGDFRQYRARRRAYQAAGRIEGRADSEVGQRWLEDAWEDGQPSRLLGRLHDEFQGQANLGALADDGSLYLHAGNSENPVFAFRMGDVRVASTGLYSLDRSLFRFAAPGARERRVIGLGRSLRLDPDGPVAVDRRSPLRAASLSVPA
ncbi:MAG TPA: class II glutamine amidotransferase [Candidatus Limnocylindrales bacterium]|nr:class II glutamine amidotransferase [Candidatus Limnocylindrales bacterium]